MNKPHELPPPQEWEEVAAVRAFQEAFGLEDETDPADWLSRYAYGVRFDYQTDCPGYVGPLYLLMGGGAPEISPLALIRTGEDLKAVDVW